MRQDLPNRHVLYIAYVPHGDVNIDLECNHYVMLDSEEDGIMLYLLHTKPSERFMIDDSVSDLRLRYKKLE